MPNVREPRDWNLAVWRQARQTAEGIASWIDEHVRQIGGSELFRWFDSGDLQGVDMLRAIVEQDHGYHGPQVPQGSVFIGTVNISRSDYHAIIRQAKSDGILNID